MIDIVSVIIPTFNSEEFIGEAIRSVFSQDYAAVEIVVVDDGSTDNTVAAVKQAMKGRAERFQLIELGANRGPSAARNIGLRAATGSWVQFLDSDDLLMPQKIKRQMAVAAAAPASVAAIYSPWNWGFYDDGKIEWHGATMKPFIAGKSPIMCLVGGCRPLLGACLIRRQALDKSGGFDESLRFWECEEACVRLAAVGQFVAAPSDEPEYFWRLRRNELYIGRKGARYSSVAVSLGWIQEILRAADKKTIDELALSPSDKAMLQNDSTMWGRLLYADDRSYFKEYLQLVQAVCPNFLPTYPFYIAAISRIIGCEKAEAVAEVTRQPKVWLRTILYKLKLRRPNTIIELR